MIILAALADSTTAGIITASATVIIALGGLVTAIGVLIPILRGTRRNTVAIDENQRVTAAKLGVIHTLVNSTLTAALQDSLDSTRREALWLTELARMHEQAGHPVSEDQRAVLGATRRRIQELEAAMADRAQQTRMADIQISTEHARETHA